LHFLYSGFETVQLIASRIVPFIDCALLEERSAREALLRDRDGGFFLYLSDSDGSSVAGERLIRLGFRDALIWLNESAETSGEFWE
jgi:hypothetical protein